MYFRGVVGTLFSDGLASGARRHTQDMDLMWPGWPAQNAARQHARTHTWAWEVVFTTAAKHGQTWGWRTIACILINAAHSTGERIVS